MKKIYMLGDFESNTGPANANRIIFNNLNSNFIVKKSKNKNLLKRVIDCFFKIIYCDALFVCSKSRINFFAFRCAKILRKPIIYLMHGCPSLEAQWNDMPIEIAKAAKKYDNYILKKSTKIICVSKFFSEFMKENYAIYANKFDYIYHTINLKKIENKIHYKDNERIIISSAGGGSDIKNNLFVAKAIEELIQEGFNIEYRVFGSNGNKDKEIKTYNFVKWMGQISHNEFIANLNESNIYIQNSTFESFGIALIEAFYSGCSLLMSNNTGCKDLFKNLKPSYIIFDVKSIQEISMKIKMLIKKPNNMILKESFDELNSSNIGQQTKLKEIFNSII